MNGENTFSLTIMVIIMALLAIFIGYLLGNWIIQMVTGDSTNLHQVVKKEVTQEEVIDGDNNSGTNNNNNIQTRNSTPSPSSTTSPKMSSKTEKQQSNFNNNQNISQQIQGEVFVVQVGAFNNYDNALSLKNELESKGFQVVVTDGVPHKVQLGATTTRKDAEQTEEEVKSMGYNAFITH